MFHSLKTLKATSLPPWTPAALAAAGAVLYFIQAVIYAHTAVSDLDEGSYLLKGILYLRGVYEPFEPYGPLTNKAPFAFLIPGFAELLFGAGLRTGRYFAIFLGLLTVLGVWITARRWSGAWIAAGAVWVFALNPMLIRLYAYGVSQVIIACMLAWICALALAEKRPLWQIIAASVLAALAVLTRQNMALVLPFLILYVFWQHGKEKGLWALAAGSAVFFAVHAYYWPNILVIWVPWLPESLTPFLDAFRLPNDAVPVWAPEADVWSRVNAFFQGMRYHFIPVFGSFFALLLWPRRADWKSPAAMRAAVFLALTYFTLFFLHAWVSVVSQYCVFCFTNYLAFFAPLGILLFALILSAGWRPHPGGVSNIVITILVLSASAGMGYSLFEYVGDGFLSLPVPRLRPGAFPPAAIALADLLKYRLHLDLPQSKRLIATLVGFTLGLGVLILSVGIWRRRKTPRFALALVNSFLAAGLLLSPALQLGANRVDCRRDLILANERIGAHLAAAMPPGSLVYWDGGNSFTPMLYVPHARIFPPQINGGYTYRIGGDPDTLYRFSHWNDELAREWRSRADIFVVEAKRFPAWRDFFDPQQFEELEGPADIPSCDPGSALRIFQRRP